MRLLTIILALSVLVLRAAYGEEPGDFAIDLDQEIQRLEQVNLHSSTSGDRDASPACKARYASFYNKRVLKISFGFGYQDGTPGDLVWDRHAYLALRSRLLSRCRSDLNMCGFTADRKDPDLLRKVVFAPTDENNYLIELRITRGSISDSNAYNTSPANIERQMAFCQRATDKFFGEVAAGADVVIYNGHSRDGGGPDFCPPNKTAANHVNYSWYKAKRPGLTRLLESMRAANVNGTPNQVVGLFSCSSQLHFKKALAGVNQTAGYILTNRVTTFFESIMDSYAALDSLLSQRCEDGFRMSFSRDKSAAWFNMFHKDF